MTDVEYGDEYAVFITSKGIKFLTNDVSLQIMELLAHSGMTVTELSDILDQQKTSIQSNVKKLERWDFITSYIDDNDKRKTVYVPSSVKIMNPIRTPFNIGPLEKEIMGIMNKEGGQYKGIILLMVLESMKLGLDFSPLMLRGGSLLAKYAEKNYKGMDTETLLKTIKKNFSDAKFPDTTLSFDDDELHIEMKMDPESERSLMMISPVMIGYLIEAISANTGIRYCIGYVKVDDNAVYAAITPYIGKIDNGTIIDEMIKEDFCNGWPLSIYHVEGNSVLFGNDVQVKILDILSRSEMSLKGLSNTLNIPPVTIHTNINKLIESRVIKSDNARSSKYVRYSLHGEPAITATKSEKNLRNEMEILFRRYASDPTQYYKAMFRYVNHSFRLVGFDISNIIKHIGMNVANSIIEENPEISAMDYLKKTCEKDMGLGFKPSVETYIPLTIRLDRKGQTLSEFRFIRPFYEGLFKFGLLRLTGDDHNIRFPFTGRNDTSIKTI